MVMQQSQGTQSQDATAGTDPASTASRPTDAEYQAPSVSPSVAPEPEATTQQPGESNVDYQARLQEYEQQLEAERQRSQQLQGTLSQVEQWAQQYARQQKSQQQRSEFEQRKDRILKQADTMRSDEANRFIAQELSNLHNEFEQRVAQIEQQKEQEKWALAKQISTPLYIQQLAKQHSLPADAVAELEAYGDPDMAYRQAPIIKKRYDDLAKLQEQLRQASRTQQAQQAQQAGIGMVGGQTSHPSGLEIPDGLSGDDLALYIYKNL